MDDRRALVIGAGIGGLTAALALMRRGWSVRVFERAPAPSEVGAGISIWGNAARILDALEIGDSIRGIGEPLALGEMRLASGRLQSRMDMARLDHELGVTSVIVHRAELQSRLLSALPEGCVTYSRELVALKPEGLGATASFGDGTEEDASVVGADGLRSKAREFVIGDAAADPVRYSGYTCWRGVTDVGERDAIPRGYVCEAWGHGERFGMLRMTARRLYWFATKNAARGESLDPREVRRQVEALARRFFDPIPRIVTSTPDAAILRHDLFDRPPRRGWSRGRVVLLGDAAHPTTPNVGQGGCLAIEDAWILARELSRGGPIEAAFARYETARYQRCAEITTFSWRLGKVGQLENAVACAIRDLALRLTPSRAIAARHRRYVGFDATRD